MFEINLYDLGYCDEKEYTRVVCVCKYFETVINRKNKIIKESRGERI